MDIPSIRKEVMRYGSDLRISGKFPMESFRGPRPLFLPINKCKYIANNNNVFMILFVWLLNISNQKLITKCLDDEHNNWNNRALIFGLFFGGWWFVNHPEKWGRPFLVAEIREGLGTLRFPWLSRKAKISTKASEAKSALLRSHNSLQICRGNFLKGIFKGFFCLKRSKTWVATVFCMIFFTQVFVSCIMCRKNTQKKIFISQRVHQLATCWD